MHLYAKFIASRSIRENPVAGKRYRVTVAGDLAILTIHNNIYLFYAT